MPHQFLSRSSVVERSPDKGEVGSSILPGTTSYLKPRGGGGAVYRSGLENRRTFARPVGSNPTRPANTEEEGRVRA